jgi:serine/threonine protein kinase
MAKIQFESVARDYCKANGITYNLYLGNGAYKEVYYIKKGSQEYALKIIDPKKVDIKRLKREINGIQACDSPYISKFYGIDNFEYKDVHYLLTIEEYLDGGTLAEKTSKKILSFDDIKTIALSITSAIQCMSAHKLVHRDIKTENILYRKSTNEPVLVDFGLVRDLSSSSLTQDWAIRGPGTPFFAAPEQLNNDKPLIDWKTDQFSLGVVLSICFSGLHPYDDGKKNPNITVSVVARREEHPPFFKLNRDKSWYSLISKMTAPWPHQRYNAITQLFEDIEKLES